MYRMGCELALVAGRPRDPPGCAAGADPSLSCRPPLPRPRTEGNRMKRVIGMDAHLTFAEVVVREGGRLRPHGRVGMARSRPGGFGRTLDEGDEVVADAIGDAMAVVRVPGPYMARVIVANPLPVRAIARARIETDKIDAGVLASLRAGLLPEVWNPTPRRSAHAGWWRAGTRSCAIAHG